MGRGDRKSTRWKKLRRTKKVERERRKADAKGAARKG